MALGARDNGFVGFEGKQRMSRMESLVNEHRTKKLQYKETVKATDIALVRIEFRITHTVECTETEDLLSETQVSLSWYWNFLPGRCF